MALLKCLPESADFETFARSHVWIIYGGTVLPSSEELQEAIHPLPEWWQPQPPPPPASVFRRSFAATVDHIDRDEGTQEVTVVWLNLLDSVAHYRRPVMIPMYPQDWRFFLTKGRFSDLVAYNLFMYVRRPWTLWGFLPLPRQSDFVLFSRIMRGEDIQDLLRSPFPANLAETVQPSTAPSQFYFPSQVATPIPRPPVSHRLGFQVPHLFTPSNPSWAPAGRMLSAYDQQGDISYEE